MILRLPLNLRHPNKIISFLVQNSLFRIGDYQVGPLPPLCICMCCVSRKLQVSSMPEVPEQRPPRQLGEAADVVLMDCQFLTSSNKLLKGHLEAFIASFHGQAAGKS